MRYMLSILLLIGFLNISDYFFTVKALELGFKERNPVINLIIDTYFFPFLKLLLVPMGLFVIWKLNNKTIFISILITFVFLIYFIVNIYHVCGLTNLHAVLFF